MAHLASTVASTVGRAVGLIGAPRHAVLHRASTTPTLGPATVNPPGRPPRPPKVSAEHSEKLFRPGSGEQLGAFHATSPDDRLFALWRLLAMTGMRRGEALGLQWADVDIGSPAPSAWLPGLDTGQRRPQMSEPKTPPRPAHRSPRIRRPWRH